MLSRSFPDLIDAKFIDYANFSNDQSGIYLTPTVFKDSILVTGLTKVYQYGFGN